MGAFVATQITLTGTQSLFKVPVRTAEGLMPARRSWHSSHDGHGGLRWSASALRCRLVTQCHQARLLMRAVLTSPGPLRAGPGAAA
ncbi:hypothetical protein D0Z06_06975 [Geodermatophilus marinus]|nr:hypothetical protein D0Z06_06975 [Geodermatophilus sp. LHW52908]